MSYLKQLFKGISPKLSFQSFTFFFEDKSKAANRRFFREAFLQTETILFFSNQLILVLSMTCSEVDARILIDYL